MKLLKNENVNATLLKNLGTHLILDLNGCSQNLSNIEHIKQTLITAATTAGATVLQVNAHYFEPQGGVSGVALLSESHISIHTWPEFSYAAIDIFLCSNLDPDKSIDVLQKAFLPAVTTTTKLKRGIA